MKFLCCLFLFALSTIAYAQPGWIDYTQSYYYQILDSSGKEIAFKNNTDYSIVIDGKRYHSKNIPTDKLTPTSPEDYNFNTNIRINDFSLKILKRDEALMEYPLEIKIIYHSDTLFINQNTNSGSREDRSYGDPYIPKPDYDISLQFIPGRYYFPNWAKSLLRNFPKTSGNVKIVNFDQRHFIISKELYEEYQHSSLYWGSKESIRLKKEETVLKHFTDGYLKASQKIEPTQFVPTPFTRHESWYEMYRNSPTNSIGLVKYANDSISRQMFITYNQEENAVKHWSPTENLYLSSTYKLYKDTFNNVLYSISIVRSNDCTFANYPNRFPYSCPYTREIYSSRDNGEKWTAEHVLSKLFQKQELRNLAFLDKEFVLAFYRREIKHPKKKYPIQQGVYYLLKNNVIIDSLETPNDVHYNDNYNHYQFELFGDSALIGQWGIDSKRIREVPYSKLTINKEGDQWKFKVSKQFFEYKEREGNAPDTTTQDFQNFKLLKGNQLVFKNGAGALTLERRLVNNQYDGTQYTDAVFVIEKGKQICLTRTNGLTYYSNDAFGGSFVLLSFDGGTSWYINPEPLDKDNSYYQFLDLNENGEVTIFNKWKFYKKIWKFEPLH